MAHPDGELATSRAYAHRNIPMAISSFCNHPLEEITTVARAVAPISHLLQVYTMRDSEKQERIIRRAEAAACKAILPTADSPVLGVRYNEVRKDFRTPVILSFLMLEWDSEKIQSQAH
ncbi:hypothetical protein EYZ11_008951 [Aspergillus tanneri]|uniref:FMN hydroxy acid dehydrogenase domain-containing protein n=1 Tax=Aspergillus tanneri TaxID=1220188 RepID=A0A4S3J948_9EURO|nr:uncharacterized protein ATNIH1004_000066 [Aspergillus tanneri]KAA8651188.1 hypothetical protein ATNIH1004_000066 [Aspergillus tanneri]THC91583.1 hypothetical protein EYZ11_008951 [Aspergillus tanneri]